MYYSSSPHVWSKDNNSFSQGCRTLPGPDVIPNFKLGGELARRGNARRNRWDAQKSPQFRLRARKFRANLPSPPSHLNPLYGLTSQLCHYSDCSALSSLAVVDAPLSPTFLTVIYRVSRSPFEQQSSMQETRYISVQRFIFNCDDFLRDYFSFFFFFGGGGNFSFNRSIQNCSCRWKREGGGGFVWKFRSGRFFAQVFSLRFFLINSTTLRADGKRWVATIFL